MTTHAPTPISATKRSFTAALCLSAAMLMGGSALAAGSSDTDAERLERWRDIAKSIFGDRAIEPTDALIKVDAPPRALDASLVPITLMMPEKDRIAAVHLIIDDNPVALCRPHHLRPRRRPERGEAPGADQQLHQRPCRGRDQGRQALRGREVRQSLGRLFRPHGDERRGGPEGGRRHEDEVRRGRPGQAHGGDADGPSPEFQRDTDEPDHPRLHAGALHQ